ncbi:MAG: hypothetical protein ABI835_09620 [Chloroflexota bacterium]
MESRQSQAQPEAKAEAKADQQQILQFMIAEHTSLQSARSSTIFEANGRIGLYFGAISSIIVALAFIGQASDMGDAFLLFSLILLPPLFFMGLVTFGRMLDVLVEDLVYARGINRIRHYYLEIAPQMRPYFIQSANDDVWGAARNTAVNPTFYQYFLTASGLVSVVNGVIGGVVIALFATRFLNTAQPVTIGLGIVGFVILVALHMRAQSRRFESAYAQFDTLFPSKTTPEGEHTEA